MASPSDASQRVEEFSLVRGGPIYRLQALLGLAVPEPKGIFRRAALSVAITWLPLLIFSSVEGHALGGVRIPFLRDFAVDIRFLIALPLLIAAEAAVDPRVRHAVRYFIESGLVTPELRPAYSDVVDRTKRLRDSIIPAAVLVFCALVPSFPRKEGVLSAMAAGTWHAQTIGEGVSLAAFWFYFVSLPLYRIVLVRWVWLLILWTIFLRRVARLPLYCVPTHPDEAGGLGFLAQVQLFFAPVTLAFSAVVASGMANAIVYAGASLDSLKYPIAGFCALAVALQSIPLLAVSKRLIPVKLAGVLNYGALGSAYVQRFDGKWIRSGPPDESLLGSSDIQSLADLSNSFAVVRRMRMVPIDSRILIGLALPALVPMIVLVLAVTPADEVIGKILLLLK